MVLSLERGENDNLKNILWFFFEKWLHNKMEMDFPVD